MYSYFQLLIRNALIGLCFCAAITAVTIMMLTSYLSEKQSHHKDHLSSLFEYEIAKNTTINSGSTIEETAETGNIATNSVENAQSTDNNDSLIAYGKTLATDQLYALILIKKNNEETIYLHENKLANLLSKVTSPAPVLIGLKSTASTIEFKLNTNNETNFVFKLLLVTYLACFAFIFIAGYFSLARYKKMLIAISQQIKNEIAAITEKDNSLIEHDEFFDIPELKEGIKEIKQIFKSHFDNSSALEKEAYVEPLTQLKNRSSFVQFYENEISKGSAIEFGVLTITRCSELQTINQIHGYNEGDTYICKVAEIMKTVISKYKASQLFRLNSSDFATIIPHVTLKEAENFAKELTDKFNDYQQASDLDSVAYTGLVHFKNDKPLGELLALADTGISVAQTQRMNAWYSQKDINILDNPSANYGNQNWRQEIDSVIENQRVTLLVQHIQPNSRNSKVYGEVLARFLNSNDEMLPTASFIAMAEKLDKIVAVDKLIIEAIINEITSKNLHDQNFGVNLSARSIHDEHFQVWLERRLLREPSIAPKIIFEITEYGLQQNIKTSKRFIDMIHRVGSRITVERFGVGLTSFKFFRDLKPDYIKMDSTYTRDIDEDKNNQYFLRLMVDLAHRLSIQVLAESVESQEEKHTLEKLFIDGCQGFYIGKPTSL